MFSRTTWFTVPFTPNRKAVCAAPITSMTKMMLKSDTNPDFIIRKLNKVSLSSQKCGVDTKSKHLSIYNALADAVN